MLILAACGGSAGTKPQTSWQTVNGPGFHFQAPAGWKVGSATASKGSQLVQVKTFPLARVYTAALFGKVAAELRARMNTLAQQTGGRVTGVRTVTADKIRSHAFDVTAGDHVDEYTFVLRGKREYLILCRRAATGDRSFCDQLVKSFAA